MSVAVMMQRIAGASPRFRARMAGVLYLLSVVAAACTELFLRGRLNVAGGLVANAGMAAVTLILYTIFKPVNKRLALLAAFFNFVGLAFEALRLNPRGVDVALVFTGFYCLLIGYLMFRSTFVPRILGALMAFAGLGWLTYLSNPLVSYLSPYNLACALLAEGSVFLWLLVMGVNTPKWLEKASLVNSRP
jgi:FtsH-binding integral membrane protein